MIIYNKKTLVSGWMDGWVGGRKGGKAGLRIAYSNQKPETKWGGALLLISLICIRIYIWVDAGQLSWGNIYLNQSKGYKASMEVQKRNVLKDCIQQG